jgi:hypothetical protein
MTRIIRIESCNKCPHVSHRGAFGPVAYVPRCTLLPDDKATLPHTIAQQVFMGGKPVASATGEIPENCPLEKPT